MVDYSLPIAKRTRLRRAMINEENVEHRKKRKKKNRADSSSANVRGQGFGDGLGKKVNSFENCSVNRGMKKETAVLFDDSDDMSVEEIDAFTFSQEGGDSVTFIDSESSGSKDVKKVELGFEGVKKEKFDVIDLEDDVILLDVEEGFDSVNSNCSISKSAGIVKDGDFVCVDVDNDDGISDLISVGKEKGGLVISPNSTGRSNCLNSSGRDSSGRSYWAEVKVGEQEKSEEYHCNVVGAESMESDTESEALSSDDDIDDSSDENYELEKSDEAQISERSCSSSGEDKSSGEDDESHFVVSGKERGERRKGGKLIEAGLKRRKAYGLDILLDVDEDGHNKIDKNEDAEVVQQLNCVAQRTRSRRSLKSRMMYNELGTVSQPVCIDVEESDSQCSEKELDTSSKHDISDSHDNTDSDVGETSKCYRQKISSSKMITDFNDQSGNGLYEVKKFHGWENLLNDERAPLGTNQGNQNECLHQTPNNFQELDNVAKIRGCKSQKSYGGRKLWNDESAPPRTNQGNLSESLQQADAKNFQEADNVTKFRGCNSWKSHGGRNLWNDEKEAPGTNQGNLSECLQQAHAKKFQEVDNVTKIRGCNSWKSHVRRNLWNDEKAPPGTNQANLSECLQQAHAENFQEVDNVTKIRGFNSWKSHGGRNLWNDEKAPHGTNQGNRSECLQKVPPYNFDNQDNASKIVKTTCSFPRRKPIDVLNILIDSIIEDKDLPSDELFPCTNVAPLPLKFNFVHEESCLQEKSDHEKELDKLWIEFDFALKSSQIGLLDSNTAENEDAVPSKVEQVNHCLHSDHQLIFDEEIGLRCQFCSYVKTEIKYIVPSFDKYPSGKSQKRESGSSDNIKYDDLQQNFEYPNNGSDSCAYSGRTVRDIIPGIWNDMYPHQREGFDFIWKNIAGGISLDEFKERNGHVSGSGCIVSHAPGTGKTRLTIAFLQSYMKLYPKCHPVIIAPCSMLLTWEEEFLKWKADIPFHNLRKRYLTHRENISAVNLFHQAVPSGKSIDHVRLIKLFSWQKEKSILGISYKLFEMLAGVRNGFECDKMRKILLEIPDLVVLDEGHIPRNADSRIWMTLTKMKTEKRIILTGTPFQNNFKEFKNTLCLARQEFADTIHSEDDGCLDKKRGRPRKISRGKWDNLISSIGRASEDLECAELKELRALINPFVHVYRGKILQEKLPGLRKSVIILQPEELQKRLLLGIQELKKSNFDVEYVESLISLHPSLKLKWDKNNLAVDKELLERQRLNPELGVKIKLLLEIIRLSEALNEKVLIFSQYREPLLFIGDNLKYHFNWTEGIEWFRMDGKCDLRKRQSLINTFNKSTSKVRVLLASTKACSEGIHLVGASRVVLLDVVWNPSVEWQAICRAYRIGQKKLVFIYHLITSGTREEEKYSRQVEKDRLSELVFSPDHSSNQEKLSSAVLDDKILEDIIQHEKYKNMFQKIAYQSKESGMNDSSDLEENK